MRINNNNKNNNTAVGFSSFFYFILFYVRNKTRKKECRHSHRECYLTLTQNISFLVDGRSLAVVAGMTLILMNLNIEASLLVECLDRGVSLFVQFPALYSV